YGDVVVGLNPSTLVEFKRSPQARGQDMLAIVPHHDDLVVAREADLCVFSAPSLKRVWAFPGKPSGWWETHRTRAWLPIDPVKTGAARWKLIPANDWKS
ncbi:MAG: hypothetical protein AABZ59_02830, partial [Candidatus Binatota bacterium]